MATKVNLTEQFMTLKGEPIIERDQEGNETAVTLKHVCVHALLAQSQETPQQKFENYRLASRIQDADEIELGADDITKLKQLIGKLFPPLYVGNAWLLLDPPAKE